LALLALAIGLLFVGPPRAHAAGGASSATLSQGVGMVAKPSVRVRALQRALIKRGFSVGRHGADGRFGPSTARAVRRLQAARHVRVDGIVGRRTRAALHRASRTARGNARSGRDAVDDRPAAGASRRPSTTAIERPPRPSGGPTPHSSPQPASPLQLHAERAWWRSPLLSGVLAALVAAFGAVWFSQWQRRRRAASYRMSRVGPSAEADAMPAESAAAELAAVLPVAVAVASEPPPAMPDAELMARIEPSPQRVDDRGPVIGYVTVPAHASAHHQGLSERAIERVCARDGWRLVDIVSDPDGSSLLERSGMLRALERIADGEARALVVSDARLLGRSVDLAEILKRLDGADASLVAVDLGLDTSTPKGRRVASALITMSGWGRGRPSVPVGGRHTATGEDGRWTTPLRLDPSPAVAATSNGAGARNRNGSLPNRAGAGVVVNANGAAHQQRNGVAVNASGNGVVVRANSNGVAVKANGNGAAVNGKSNGTARNADALAVNGKDHGAAHDGRGLAGESNVAVINADGAAVDGRPAGAKSVDD
jgi:hypothetical protein